MLKENHNNQSDAESQINHENSNLVDEAFGQGIITVNEYRKILGLPPFLEGDITVSKKSLSEQWKA